LENLPCVNKTKHPKKKGERKEQYGWTQVEAKRRNQDGRQQEEQEQIKYANPLVKTISLFYSSIFSISCKGYRIRSLWSIYIAQRRTTFAKAYQIKSEVLLRRGGAFTP
jgi:hypothetical protein